MSEREGDTKAATDDGGPVVLWEGEIASRSPHLEPMLYRLWSHGLLEHRFCGPRDGWWPEDDNAGLLAVQFWGELKEARDRLAVEVKGTASYVKTLGVLMQDIKERDEALATARRERDKAAAARDEALGLADEARRERDEANEALTIAHMMGYYDGRDDRIRSHPKADTIGDQLERARRAVLEGEVELRAARAEINRLRDALGAGGGAGGGT